jgi:hypothetical protein
VKRLRDNQLRSSRRLLVAVGLVLVVLAAFGAMLASKIVDRLADPLDARTAVLNEHGRRLLDQHELAFQLGAAAVALVLITVGVMWLKNQIPPVRQRQDNRFENPDSEYPGRNTVSGGAVAHALEADLERSESVARARAEFRSERDLVRLRLDVDESTSVDDVLVSIVSPAIDRIATVAEFDRRPAVQTDLRPVELSRRRIE